MPLTLDNNLLYRLLIACAFAIPLKLSVAYALLIPTILLWIYLESRMDTPGQTGFRTALCDLSNQPFYAFAAFLLVSFLLSLFGLGPLESTLGLARLTFFSLFALIVFRIKNGDFALRMVVALLSGQTLAGAHSILQGAYPEMFSRLFVGTVTESGQLALTLPLAIGMLCNLHLRKGKCSVPALCFDRRFYLGLFLFTTFVCAGFWKRWQLPTAPLPWILAVAFFITFSALLFSFRRLQQNEDLIPAVKNYLYCVCIPLMGAAMLVNLKRGPWVGLFIALSILLLRYARRLLPVLFALAIAVAVFVAPVRHRIEQSQKDFFIAGGRSTIWEIGLELSSRYPLGIGYDNSPILRDFAYTIPPELQHFHSNVLNVLVELGWIGLCTYLWWIYIVLRQGLRRKAESDWHDFSLPLACGFVSWQVAGLVEYNFGDSEVLLISFLFMGLIARNYREAKNSPNLSEPLSPKPA